MKNIFRPDDKDKQLVVSDGKGIHNEISRLETSIDTLKDTIAVVENEINDFFELMKQEHKDLVKEGDDINMDIEILTIQLRKLTGQMDNQGNSDVSDDDKECKTIYRSIAKQCHSDIEEDEERNDLFIKATNAYNRNDYHELSNIEKSLNSDNYNNCLSDRFERLKKEHDKQTKELIRLKNLFLYVALQYYNNGDEINVMMAKKIFSDWLYQRIIQMMKQKENLKKEIDDIISIKSS